MGGRQGKKIVALCYRISYRNKKELNHESGISFRGNNEG
jgi:hypothetical protein